MSHPSHHLPQSWILASAAGTLPEAEAVILATHLTLCPSCRSDLDLAEELAANALQAHDPLALDPSGIDSVFARLDAADPEPEPLSDPILPWPILQHTGPLEQVRWRWLAPGIGGVSLPHETTGLPLQLIRLQPGRHLPHRHVGSEAGVLLAGGWTDETGHYERGDAFYTEPSEGIHDQRIDPGPPCIALVLNEARGKVDGIQGLFARAFFKV